MCFKLGAFEGASLTHLQRKCKQQCEISHLDTYLAHQTCPVDHTMPHICTKLEVVWYRQAAGKLPVSL